MKKTKSQKPDEFVYHISKPLLGYGLPKKQNQKSNSKSGKKAKRKF